MSIPLLISLQKKIAGCSYKLVLIIPGFICSFIASAQTYTTRSQESNISAGRAYVAPVVTKTYTVPTPKPSPSHYTAPAAALSTGNYDAGGSNTSYGNKIVLFAGFRERAQHRKYRREWSKKQHALDALSLELKEWKLQATAMMSHYKSGNYAEATNIMLSIQPLVPGSGDKSFQRTYNYTCIRLLSDISEYKAVIDLSIATPEVINGLPNDFANCNAAEALMIKSAYVEAVHHESGIAVARAKWKAIADSYTPYFIGREKDINATGLCHNVIATRYFQLGLFEAGSAAIQKQLSLYPGDEKIRFDIYQNLIPLVAVEPEKNTSLRDFCMEGIESIIKDAKKKKEDKGFLYGVNHSKAYLFFLKKEYTAAEAILKAETNPPAAYQFDHHFLRLQVLNELSEIELKIDIIAELKKIYEKRWADAITPAQKARHDSLMATSYFDKLDGEYITHTRDNSNEESKLYSKLLADTSLSNDASTELRVFGAEKELRTRNYELAKILFNSLTFGNETDAWRYLIRTAQITVMEGNTKEAISILKKTIADFEGVYEPYLALADIYRHNSNEPRKAKENYLLAFNNGAFLSDDVMVYLDSK